MTGQTHSCITVRSPIISTPPDTRNAESELPAYFKAEFFNTIGGKLASLTRAPS